MPIKDVYGNFEISGKVGFEIAVQVKLTPRGTGAPKVDTAEVADAWYKQAVMIVLALIVIMIVAAAPVFAKAPKINTPGSNQKMPNEKDYRMKFA